MARWWPPPVLRSFEHYVWMTTGRRVHFTLRTRGSSITVRLSEDA